MTRPVIYQEADIIRALYDHGVPQNQWAAFMANMKHESDSFRARDEYDDGTHYAYLEGREDLGNSQPGDGARFHGRGIIQLTGRNNYAEAGEALELDLIGHPELAAEPENAARIAIWYWEKKVPEDARTDINRASAYINCEHPETCTPNGIEERRAHYRDYMQRMPTLIAAVESEIVRDTMSSGISAAIESLNGIMENFLPLTTPAQAAPPNSPIR